MPHEHQPLPYATDALEPHISAQTVEEHYGGHHRGYVKTLNRLAEGTRFADMDLAEIIKSAKPGDLWNAAAQTFNHDFYWRCLTPDPQQGPDGPLRREIERDFGSFAGFRKEFEIHAKELFGSGWVWLARDYDGTLSLAPLKDAGNPLMLGRIPLLVCDVWEHAYYLDYRRHRDRYLESFWPLVNWDFVSVQRSRALEADIVTR